MDTTNNITHLEKLSLWDALDDTALAPLGNSEKDSFLELASIASNRPLPKEVPLEEPVTIGHKVALTGALVPGSTEEILSQGFAKLGMGRNKIENAQQFYSWYSKIEEHMSQKEADVYHEQVETLKKYQQYCQHITNDVNKALESLTVLDKEYVFVSTKTNALHEACEHLLADQTNLINTAEEIHKNLKYFNEIDKIKTKLSSTNLLVTGESFQAMLSTIDECIDYMSTHASYKGSADYLLKYKTSLSTALGLIKSYVVKSLESTTQSILNRKQNEAASNSQEGINRDSNEDAFTLYYGKFRTNAPKIKGVVEQIEQRLEKNEEYKHLLSDVHYCYFSQRELLLSPSVSSAMTELVNLNKQDHCALVRSGCAFMVHVCEDEFQLYGHFFSNQSPKLHEMLLRLCGNLYDLLRPLIIHVSHMETLAELCTILKTEMIDDHVQNNPEQLQAFHSIASQMLEDVQERLVFRANVYIRDDIRGYKPSPGDVAYPEKLQMMEEIAQSLKESNKNLDGSFTEIQLTEEIPVDKNLSLSNAASPTSSRNSQKFQTSPADMHGMWFPTVRRVLVCLSKLYRCIDKTIFQGLSQEALEACVQSLVSAANSIKTSNLKKQPDPKSNKKIIDGQLFLIKHLLILREQIAPFQADFAIRETQLDFSRTKDAAFKFVLEPSSITNLLKVNANNSLLQFVYQGAPEVKEFYIDSKKDVDRQLKLVCEEFISYQTSQFCGPVIEFLEKANKFVDISKEEGIVKSSLRQQHYATPEVLHTLISQVYRDLKLLIKKTATSMSLYLANRETENILFKPIKMNVQQVFQKLHMLFLENYTDEDKAIIAAPGSDQVGLVSVINISLQYSTQANEHEQLHIKCLAQLSVTVVPCAASLFTMTVIGVDRYTSIMHPIKYDLFMKLWKSLCAVGFIWIASVLLGFAPMMGWGKQNIDISKKCSFLYVVEPSYVAFMCFGLFIPSVTLVIYLHVRLFKVSRKHNQQIALVCPTTPKMSESRAAKDILKNQIPLSHSCPVSPVMGRACPAVFSRRVSKDLEFDSQYYSRTVSINPSCSTGIRFSLPDDDDNSVFEKSLDLPGTIVNASNLVFADKEKSSISDLGKVVDRPPVGPLKKKINAASLRRTQSYANHVRMPSFTTQITNRLKSSKLISRDVKALRTVTMVTGFFFIMWSPFLITSSVQIICGSACHLQNIVATYLLCLGLTNSAINPIIYTYTNRELKKYVRSLFTQNCKFCIRRRERSQNKVTTLNNANRRTSTSTTDRLSVPKVGWHKEPRHSLTSEILSYSDYALNDGQQSVVCEVVNEIVSNV